jgi:cell envelope opacity-associated protein A
VPAAAEATGLDPGQEARASEWKKVEPRKKLDVVRQQHVVDKHQNAVVIYTQATAEELMAELARQDPEVAYLVASTRQKEGHVVLMATTDDVQSLKDCLPWLKKWGIQAKEYMVKPGTLANSAAQGWKDQTREAGVCHHFLKDADCPFRGRCKFKCYPDG